MESKIKSSCKIQCVYVMLNPVCDWICEEVLYTHLILATFKNKFICDQAINPKISLVLVQVMAPYFKAVSQTQAKFIYNLSWLLESKNSLIYCFVNPNLWPALFLSNHLLQEYLKWIVTIKENEEDIKILMRDLATPIDIDLVISEEIQYIAGKLYTLEANNKIIQLQSSYRFFQPTENHKTWL